MDKIIITGIDENPHYKRTLIAFLCSIAENAPTEHVLVELTNCDDKYAKEIKKLHKNIKIIKKSLIKKKVSYYSNRFLLVNQMLKKDIKK